MQSAVDRGHAGVHTRMTIGATSPRSRASVGGEMLCQTLERSSISYRRNSGLGTGVRSPCPSRLHLPLSLVAACIFAFGVVALMLAH